MITRTIPFPSFVRFVHSRHLASDWRQIAENRSSSFVGSGLRILDRCSASVWMTQYLDEERAVGRTQAWLPEAQRILGAPNKAPKSTGSVIHGI